jgi:hypothetical protein
MFPIVRDARWIAWISALSFTSARARIDSGRSRHA